MLAEHIGGLTMQVRHEVTIDAPASVVWQVLVDGDDYPNWNPFIRRLHGELRTGSRIEVEIANPGRRSMTFRPRVLVVQPERELCWRGRLLVPGLFTGEHRFELQPIGDARTRLVQSERFSGVLVPFVRRMLRSTELGFGQMNHALSERARRVSTPSAPSLDDASRPDAIVTS